MPAKELTLGWSGFFKSLYHHNNSVPDTLSSLPTHYSLIMWSALTLSNLLTLCKDEDLPISPLNIPLQVEDGKEMEWEILDRVAHAAEVPSVEPFPGV